MAIPVAIAGHAIYNMLLCEPLVRIIKNLFGLYYWQEFVYVVHYLSREWVAIFLLGLDEFIFAGIVIFKSKIRKI